MPQSIENRVSVGSPTPQRSRESLTDAYQRVRSTTTGLIETLEAEDTVVQTMPDVSPSKWHLAHTSWFFEHFVLEQFVPGYRVFNERYTYLFNSYYFTVGQMHRRVQRGLLSRPTLAQVLDYRRHVDTQLHELLSKGVNDELAFLIRLGLNHEQQHQELLLTDIKHVFSCNPLKPVFRETPDVATTRLTTTVKSQPTKYVSFDGGIAEVGARDNGFHFDNEGPRHEVLLRPFALASGLVTNADYTSFIEDGGYRKPELWLSDGWTAVQTEQWQHPMYWDDALEQEFTLAGLREIDSQTPVCHVSFFEADAFARWAHSRLPTEFEWEVAAAKKPVAGNLLDTGRLHPRANNEHAELTQLFGDVWEWTSSPYAPYPGFRPLAGSLGEYNGKFMCSQMVLRGGSCATPADHVRATYRNFFYPPQRWQFSGIRLARDVT